MLSVDQRALKILSICSDSALSVSEIVLETGGNHEKTIKVLNDLRSGALVETQKEKEQGRGRPKHLVTTTPLGRRFIADYQRLLNLPLKSREPDIKKALHQAELTQKLIASGISPYARFQELNELARNIARTSKAKQRA